MTRRNRKPFPFFLWHRRIGLVALVLVVILSVTGMLLNHTEALRLDEKSIESDLVLDWYDMNPEGEPICFREANIWLSQWDHQLFLNGKPIFTHEEQLQGMVQLDDMIVIALQTTVLLVDHGGEVIELMPANTDANISSIAPAGDVIALLDASQATYVSDPEMTRWQPQPVTDLEWVQASELSRDELDILKKAYRGNGLNLEKFILDLHSGRIFNQQWGIYIMDASALIIIVLGLSGWWIWYSRRLKMRSKKHYRKHHNLD